MRRANGNLKKPLLLNNKYFLCQWNLWGRICLFYEMNVCYALLSKANNKKNGKKNECGFYEADDRE